MAPYRACGYRIDVDDAGAAYAWLRHITELRPEFVKLDAALIRGLTVDRARQARVRAMATFVGEIGAVLVARGRGASRRAGPARSGRPGDARAGLCVRSRRAPVACSCRSGCRPPSLSGARRQCETAPESTGRMSPRAVRRGTDGTGQALRRTCSRNARSAHARRRRSSGVRRRRRCPPRTRPAPVLACSTSPLSPHSWLAGNE